MPIPAIQRISIESCVIGLRSFFTISAQTHDELSQAFRVRSFREELIEMRLCRLVPLVLRPVLPSRVVLESEFVRLCTTDAKRSNCDEDAEDGG